MSDLPPPYVQPPPGLHDRVDRLEETQAEDHDWITAHRDTARRHCAMLDNNGASIPSRLARIEERVALLLWLAGANALAAITALVTLVITHVARG